MATNNNPNEAIWERALTELRKGPYGKLGDPEFTPAVGLLYILLIEEDRYLHEDTFKEVAVRVGFNKDEVKKLYNYYCCLCYLRDYQNPEGTFFDCWPEERIQEIINRDAEDENG